MKIDHNRHSLTRRALLRDAAIAAAACGAPFARAERTSPDAQWRLLVNEGVASNQSISMLAFRYRALGDYVSAQIKGHQMLIDPIVDIRRFVQQATAEQKPLVVFGKSVNQVALLVRDHGYHPLVRHPDPFKGSFIVPNDSPLRSATQLAGRRLILPDEFSATATLARAELRHTNILPQSMAYTKFVESAVTELVIGHADAAVVNAATAAAWVGKGGRVIGETQPVVNWSVLAAPSTPADTVSRLTDGLLAMNSLAPAILAEIGVKPWVRADKQEYLALLQYTGE
jgi:ABC-type phosphate/phosphonate transport system substrate-binding protein